MKSTNLIAAFLLLLCLFAVNNVNSQLSPSNTDSPSNTASGSPSNTDSPSNTASGSPSNTDSPSNTASGSPSQTDSPSNTASGSPSQTDSPSNTASGSPSQTDSPSNTASGSPSQTDSPSNTASGSPSQTDSGSVASSPSNTASPVSSTLQTASPSNTASPVSSTLQTASPSNTASAAASPSAVPPPASPSAVPPPAVNPAIVNPLKQDSSATSSSPSCTLYSIQQNCCLNIRVGTALQLKIAKDHKCGARTSCVVNPGVCQADGTCLGRTFRPNGYECKANSKLNGTVQKRSGRCQTRAVRIGANKLRKAGLPVPTNSKDLPKVVTLRCVAVPIGTTDPTIVPGNAQKITPPNVIQKGKGVIDTQL